MNILEIKFNKSKMMMSVIALSVLAIGSAAMIYVVHIQQWTFLFGNWGWKGVWGFAVLAFAFAAFFMSKRSANPLPAIVLDEQGLTDNAGLVRGAKHLWSGIERFEQKNMFGSTIILVHLKDADAFIETQSGIKKKLLASNYKQQGTPVSIPFKALEGNPAEILDTLKKWHDKFKI